VPEGPDTILMYGLRRADPTKFGFRQWVLRQCPNFKWQVFDFVIHTPISDGASLRFGDQVSGRMSCNNAMTAARV
jgi:hypothetical protein